MTDAIDKHNLTPDQQAMLGAWQQHAYAEFVLKDADAALATMTKNPYCFSSRPGWAASVEPPSTSSMPISFCRKSPRILNSPPCRRLSAPIASSKKW